MKYIWNILAWLESPEYLTIHFSPLKQGNWGPKTELDEHIKK